MSENTKIQWTDNTFNPWIGCTKVSPGCKNCYAESSTPTRVARDKGVELWGKGNPRQRTSAANWRKPLKWDRDSAEGVDEGVLLDKDIRRQRVFCASLADWLDDEVPIEWLADLLKMIHDTPNLDWQLLTKRPENWKPRLRAAHANLLTFRTWSDIDWLDSWIAGIPPKNIWIGTSVEDQQRADERIPHLLKIPAKVRFLSVEPLLEAVRLNQITLNWQNQIHWVIVGGESGPKARQCNVDWIRSIVEQCKAAGVACFVKQLGKVVLCRDDDATGRDWIRRDCKTGMTSLRLKDPKGGDMEEWPEDLRVREFPGL